MDVKDSCIFRANWLNAAHKIDNPALRCAFFEAVLQYALTGMKTEAPAELDLALEVIYSLIDIDRDKYEKKIERRREAGRKGAQVTNEMRWGNQQTSAKSANADFDNNFQQTSAKSTYTDTDTVTGTVTDTGTETDKDNDFNNPPIPPRGGGIDFIKNLYNKVALASNRMPAMIQKARYETQYLWRIIDSKVGANYGIALHEAIKGETNPDIAASKIAAENAKYEPCVPFQMFKLAYTMTRLRTENQRQAVLDELARSMKEPDIYKTLAEKAEYIAQGNKVNSLKGFMQSRRD